MKYPPAWRFAPPKDTDRVNSTVPEEALEELLRLASRAAGLHPRGREAGLEHMKHSISATSGRGYSPSSSESWAETDLRRLLEGLKDEPPVLIEGIVTGCRSITDSEGRSILDDPTPINRIMEKFGMGYRISGDEILLGESIPPPTVEPVPSLIEQTAAELGKAWKRADQLLDEGHPDEAVAKIWFVLESILTVFRGLKVGDQTVEGAYFNKVVHSLKGTEIDPTFKMVLDLASRVHGQLSDPSTGRLRHGSELGIPPISPQEGRFLVGFAKSLGYYICSEYQRLLPLEHRLER